MVSYYSGGDVGIALVQFYWLLYLPNWNIRAISTDGIAARIYKAVAPDLDETLYSTLSPSGY